MRAIIEKGVDYPLQDISNKTLKEDLRAMIQRGNHKSAQLHANETSLRKNYQKEVEHGWMLPLPTESIRKLEDAAVIPIGVATQWSMNEKGDRYSKRRTTHDATFAPPSGHSINNRLICENLEPCLYGHYLLRLLHSIHAMHRHYPERIILLIKYDLDSAYRRLHVTGKMASLAVTILNGLVYALLRLPFGAANGPSDYCTISEPVIDLANDILRDTSWQPDEIHSPLQSDLDDPVSSNSDDSPLGTARPLFVNVPSSQRQSMDTSMT